MRTQSELEPGLLNLFRILTALRLGLSCLGLVRLAQAGLPALLLLLELLVGALLLIYLSLPGLRRQLGRWYLPLALIAAMLGPQCMQISIFFFLSPTLGLILLSAWQSLPAMLVPVVLAAWQYNFRQAFRLILLSTVLEIGLASLLFSSHQIVATESISVLAMELAGVVVSRTVTLALAAYMVAHLMRSQRRQRADLAAANARLVDYATTLEHLTTSRERNRLARELHDTLAHSLSAMAVQLEAADALWESTPAESHRLLVQSLATTRAGLTETRRALQALRASPLDDLGLVLGLRGLAQDAVERGRFALSLELPDALDGLSPAAEQSLYRIVQETLENIVRHAQAQQVRVRLLQDAGWVEMEISDDGIGFDAGSNDAEEHLGLRGMRERAEMVGGTLDVRSAPGQGARVRLRMEVPE